MKKRNRLLSAILMAMVSSTLFVAGCASTQEVPTQNLTDPPTWVNNPKSLFPDARYLSAVGTGDSRNQAINDARKQMAESLIVKVQSELKTRTESNLNQSSSGSLSSDSKQISEKKLSLETDSFLRGAEVRDVVQVGNQFYALVATDKLQARSGLLLEANRIQAKINPLLDELEETYSAEMLQTVKQHSNELARLFGEASALGMSALVDTSSIDARIAKIESMNRASNRKFNFLVKSVKGDERFQREIEECIHKKGGSVFVDEKAPADAFNVEVTIAEHPQHFDVEGFKKIKFNLTSGVKTPQGKIVRIQAQKIDTGRSRDAILETVSDDLAADFCGKLFNQLNELK